MFTERDQLKYFLKDEIWAVILLSLKFHLQFGLVLTSLITLP